MDTVSATKANANSGTPITAGVRKIPAANHQQVASRYE
jgi:hypothetical protein